MNCKDCEEFYANGGGCGGCCIDTDGSKSAPALGYKPWRHYADGCPWKQFRDEVLCCNGNIDDCGVHGPCNEEECAPYHFMKGL